MCNSFVRSVTAMVKTNESFTWYGFFGSNNILWSSLAIKNIMHTYSTPMAFVKSVVSNIKQDT